MVRARRGTILPGCSRRPRLADRVVPDSAPPAGEPAPVAFILKGYPRLSETFIAQEIRALEERGLPIEIISLRRPTDRHIHPVHREIRAPLRYLPEYLHEEPLRVWRAWRQLRRTSGYRDARRLWLKDLRRDFTRNRIRRFGQALVLARELSPDIRRLHAHFLHTPASVARYAAVLRGIPWTVSAHAKDIWTTPQWEKREKLASCRWLVTCTASGGEHLAALAPDSARVEIVYHGLDARRFPSFADPRRARDGSNGEDPVRLLSVGRAVPKKGYQDLLDALAQLPSKLEWRLTHIGGGADLEALKRRAADSGIADRIDWLGARPQEDVLAAYRAADLFVLASRIAADGDRDGLPNVLMEAQSQKLACVATRVSAIPELIDHGRTGILVPPEDPAALTAALADLISDPRQRQVLGEAGELRVRGAFSLDAGIERLAAKFGLTDTCVSPSTRR